MNVTEKNVVVFDLDNCLAEDASRIHLIKNSNRHGESLKPVTTQCTWNDYHVAGANAAPHNIDFFHSVVESTPRAHVVFLTARPEAFATQTAAWLHKYGFGSVPRWTLLMRKNDCLATSPEMKPMRLMEWLHSENMTLDHVKCVYDDRRDVLEAFRKLGVRTGLLAILDRG